MTSNDSHNTLLQLIQGASVTQSIYVAAKLGLADLLKDGPRHCDELAAATNTHHDTLYRLLRALASVGIFAETDARTFKLTPLATYLRRDVPNSLHDFAILRGEQDYRYWANLMHTVKTGNNAFEPTFGMGRFAYYKQVPEAGAIFRRALTAIAGLNNAAIVAAYDFSNIRTLVDIAGLQGGRLAAIMQQYPAMQGILFEQPAVLEAAKTFLAAQNLLSRCQLVAGNWFEFIPTDADAHLISTLHRWDDANASTVLQNCYQAGVKRLLIVERIIGPNTDWRIIFADLNLLLSSTGRIRTEAEFQHLLQAANFQIARIIPTESAVSLIEAIPHPS